MTDIAADRRRSLVERIERLEEERKAASDDIAEVYKEAKSAGFDVKALRALIKRRRQEPDAIEELETLIALYERPLFTDVPQRAKAETRELDMFGG